MYEGRRIVPYLMERFITIFSRGLGLAGGVLPPHPSQPLVVGAQESIQSIITGFTIRPILYSQQFSQTYMYIFANG